MINFVGAKSVLEKNLDKIDWVGLSNNIGPGIIEIIEKI